MMPRIGCNMTRRKNCIIPGYPDCRLEASRNEISEKKGNPADNVGVRLRKRIRFVHVGICRFMPVPCNWILSSEVCGNRRNGVSIKVEIADVVVRLCNADKFTKWFGRPLEKVNSKVRCFGSRRRTDYTGNGRKNEKRD